MRRGEERKKGKRRSDETGEERRGEVRTGEEENREERGGEEQLTVKNRIRERWGVFKNSEM